ncbi:hypothetical protein FB645_000145 [Coemansia sp. IMI 203386]|nr:hypothetical protein FB645_000145 [Coemansia sp. IMI 203386]
MSLANNQQNNSVTDQNNKSLDVNAQPKADVAGALEEDDEFEEFAAEDWVEEDQDKDNANNWTDNWDDDDLEDDFSKQLRAELENITHPAAIALV